MLTEMIGFLPYYLIVAASLVIRAEQIHLKRLTETIAVDLVSQFCGWRVRAMNCAGLTDVA